MLEVILSPLQMERLLFNRVHVEINTKHDANITAPEFDFDGLPIITEIASAVKSGQEENPSDFLVKVHVAILNKDDERQAPYTVDVEAQAVFHLNEAFGAPDRGELVRVNGSSMIIGAIRETITQITSRSVFGPFILPSLRVQPVTSEQAE